MGLRINQNTQAFNAYRNLSKNDNALGRSLEKLSSGFRINRASDDAAGLRRSEALRSEVRGTQQAIRNAQDGISYIQTAEGALNEIHSILQRARELAVDASNGTTDGGAPQDEIDALMAEVDAIGTRTKFAGSTIFNSSKTFQIAADTSAGSTLAVDLGVLSSASMGVSGGGTFNGNLSTISVTSSASAQAAIAKIDTAISALSDLRGDLGATQNRMEHTISNLSVAAENLSAAESRIRDTDMAMEMTKFTRNQIMTQAGTAMLAQANSAPQGVLQLLG